VAGLICAAQGLTALGMLFLALCGLADLFDGPFAERFVHSERQRRFRIQIDTLNDMLCFVALPIALLLSAGLTVWFQYIILALYMICALTRLTLFSIDTRGGGQQTAAFRGLPVTAAGFIFPALWLISYTSASGLLPWIYTEVMVLVTILFVLNIRIPRPGTVGAVVLTLIILAVVGTIIWQILL
jgi:CDP-diacylglycerol--serine O-phosphatidyltransferase